MKAETITLKEGGRKMKKCTLTLADPEGIVLEQWTIGRTLEPEYDVEDLDAEPECNFYVEGDSVSGRWNDKEDVGEQVLNEAGKYFVSENIIEGLCKCGKAAKKDSKGYYNCCGDSWKE